MDYGKLGVILMKWGLEKKDYEFVYRLYTEYSIGIPANLIYSLPEKYSFVNEESILNSPNIFMNNLFALFRESKWARLKNWNNSYGYILK